MPRGTGEGAKRDIAHDILAADLFGGNPATLKPYVPKPQHVRNHLIDFVAQIWKRKLEAEAARLDAAR
jgi:hypothetical protein